MYSKELIELLFERLEEKCQQTVKGTITRKANALPIVDVAVSLLDDTGVLLVETMTNAYGAFTFGTILDCETS